MRGLQAIFPQPQCACEAVGPVSCPHADVRMCLQHAFGLSWSTSQSRSPFMRAVPTLEAMALRRGSIPNVVLAAGASSAAILSEHGHQLDTIQFPVRGPAEGCANVMCCGAWSTGLPVSTMPWAHERPAFEVDAGGCRLFTSLRT